MMNGSSERQPRTRCGGMAAVYLRRKSCCIFYQKLTFGALNGKYPRFMSWRDRGHGLHGVHIMDVFMAYPQRLKPLEHFICCHQNLPPAPAMAAETPVPAAAVETMSDTGSEWMVIDDEGSDKPKASTDAKTGGLDQDSELDLCFICDSWHWHPFWPILARERLERS